MSLMYDEGLYLTPNFQLREWAVSRSHPSLVEPVPNRYGANMVRLTVFQLQPIRDAVGRAVITTSGYRSDRLNNAVGGSATSQHLRAEAMDWTTRDIEQVFYELIAGAIPLHAGHVGQVIYYPTRGFIHSALPSARYPKPTYCLHWPERGHLYRELRDVRHLTELLT